MPFVKKSAKNKRNQLAEAREIRIENQDNQHSELTVVAENDLLPHDIEQAFTSVSIHNINNVNNQDNTYVRQTRTRTRQQIETQTEHRVGRHGQTRTQVHRALNISREQQVDRLYNRDRPARQKQFAIKFDHHMAQQNYRVCSNCHRKELKAGPMQFCSECARNPQKFGPENDTNPGDVPECLSKLSPVESRLIARTIVCIKIMRLKSRSGAPGNFGYNGSTIIFPQDIGQVAHILPRLPTDVEIVIVSRESSTGLKEFKVRRQNIQDALVWLSQNHRFYRDIIISQEHLNELPVDGNIFQQITQVEDQEVDVVDQGDEQESHDMIVATGAMNMPTTLQDNQIKRKINYPSSTGIPISESKEGILTTTFPTLFALGKGCINSSARIHKVTISEHAKYLLRHESGRFQADPMCLYTLFDMKLRHDTMTKGKVFVKKNDFLGNSEQLRARLAEDPQFINKIQYWTSTIPGTRPYWYDMRGKLEAMLKQEKPACVFLTLSMADLWWPDLDKLLGLEELASDLSIPDEVVMKARMKKLSENPLIVDEYFYERVNFYIGTILKEYFDIVDYWFRFEYQHRGAPHVHCLLWIRGAPDPRTFDMCTPEEIDVHRRFYDRLVTAINPNMDLPPAQVNPSRKRASEVSAEDWENDLAEILNRCMRHTMHTATCEKAGQEDICRFGFPIATQEQSTLTRSENGEYIYKPARNDPLLNGYHPFIARTWRANHDIKVITSLESLIQYLAKYCSKAEPESPQFRETLQEMVRDFEGERLESLVTKLINKFTGKRDISGPEAAHLTMGFALCKCSRTFQTVYIRADGEDELVQVMDGIVDDGPIQTTITRDPIDFYMSRPSQYEALTMSEFLIKCSKKGDKIVNSRKGYILQIRPKIIQGVSHEKDEHFFKQKVLLSSRFRVIEDIKDITETWRDAYHRLVLDNGHEWAYQYEDVELDAEFAVNERDQREWMELVAAPPQVPMRDVDIGYRQIDLEHDWHASFNNWPNLKDNLKFIENLKKNTDEANRNSLNSSSIVFNLEQQKVVDHVMANLDERWPKTSMLILGKAGTGKSAIIHHVKSIVTERFGPDAIRLLAWTGGAADNIGGETICSGLGISGQRPLSNAQLKHLQNENRNLRVLVVDEISMVGCNTIATMHLRLQEITGNSSDPFGGVLLLLFGDFGQLAPVNDITLIKPLEKYPDAKSHALLGRSLFKQIKKVCVLKTIMRQQGDDQAQFRDCLANIDKGKITQEDYALLSTRNAINLGAAEKATFDDAVHLSTTKANVYDANLNKLRQLNRPVAMLLAEDRGGFIPLDCKSVDLPKTLELAVGCKVILRRNLCTKYGLTNGAAGTVEDIIYEQYDQEYYRKLPICVLVSFPDYTGPLSPYGNCLPIVPVVSTIKRHGTNITRRQFPLMLGYAVSVHRSQGLTLSKAVINLGDRDFCTGLTYVALSRVRTLQGLMFDPSPTLERYLSINNHKGLQERNKAIAELINRSE